jgi:hypothetical protein
LQSLCKNIDGKGYWAMAFYDLVFVFAVTQTSRSPASGT